MPETRPGSRAHTILGVATTLTNRLGRGAEVAELREAFEQETGAEAPSSFTSEVHSLKRRGLLDVVGGRASHSLLAPAGFEPDRRQREDDEALIVLRALRAAYVRLSRPVSTREVEEAAGRMVAPFTPDNANTVRQHLHTLCRETVRGPKAARMPKVRKITADGPSGQPTSHWLPANVEPERPATAAARSKSAAIRLATGHVQDVLGRPVTRTEIRWWLEGPGGEDAVSSALSSRHVGRRLGKAWDWDRRAVSEAGRLHRVATPLTCHGGPPIRWSLGPPGQSAEALCYFEDLVSTLRPADESESIRRLERRAATLDSPVLQRLADIRRALLAAALREPRTGMGHEEAVSTLAEAADGQRKWVAGDSDARANPKVAAQLRSLDERSSQLEAARAVLRFIPETDLPDLRIVGQAGTATWEELDPALRATSMRLGLDPARSSRLVDAARRFPKTETPGRERFGAAGEHALSVLDRPDVMGLLYDLFRLPRTTALMRDAQLCLGFGLRDGALLRELFEDVPRGDRTARRALVVALGLIGEPLALEIAVPEPDDPEATEAWLLSAVLGRWLDAAADVRVADSRAKGAARRVTDKALARIESAFPWSVIE